eukprot:gnl/MRDRNA2_/MRDRNA2_78106_c0_seq2.p1 gnl/MRDRNA2_/MRDRNA2_78106_c0~~gnl/MRDRNA2_/MRDRNA2_78106_c0_seq2.p1  ORF type:complete len:368 (-),score=68.21 gnl/MRDRNA2_/MRDRNA2_78106_c0_seq2:163-1266(-)
MCQGNQMSDTKVATVLVPGTEDPSMVLKNGKMKLKWEGTDGSTKTIGKFREQRPQQLVDDSLALPTLYLHFLDRRFFATSDELDARLKGGNDNSELRIVLPEIYMSKTSSVWDAITGDYKPKLDAVLDFLYAQGEAPTNSNKESVSIQRRVFSLVVARPKSDITIPKDKFGIPSEADLYVFAQNHRSVSFMDEEEVDAFETCISEMPDEPSNHLKAFATFLKVFFEGGFGYNKRKYLDGNSSAYLPQNVGIAALGVVPAFNGQLGISTGFPYQVAHQNLPFIDTAPVTISGISSMSERHARYGLCFTRCAFVWEGDAYASQGILDFCCVLPHGGFYYVPTNLKKYKHLGSLIYAFGEDKESANQMSL